MTPNAVFCVALASSVPRLAVARRNEGQRSFYFLHYKCLFQQLVSFSTGVYIEMQPRMDEVMCIHFTGSIKEVPYRLAVLDSKIVAPSSHLRAHAPSASAFRQFWEASRAIPVLVQDQDRGKPGKRDVLTS